MTNEDIPRNELYAGMEKVNRNMAYELAFKEIKDYQGALRHLNPRNPLVNIISLRLVCREPFFYIPSSRSIHMLFEHTEARVTDSLAILLGHYVELLRSEINNPRFPPRVY